MKEKRYLNPAIYYVIWTFIVAIFIYIGSGEDVSDTYAGWVPWMTQTQGQILSWGYIIISILTPFINMKWFKKYWGVSLVMLIVGIVLLVMI